jgi:Ca2+-binding RTX toxin-like protein
MSALACLAAGLIVVGSSPASAPGASTEPVNGLIAVGGEYSLGMVAPDGSGRYPVTGSGSSVPPHPDLNAPAWSPDGSVLAVQSRTDELAYHSVIRIVDRMGNVSDFVADGDQPAWTPTGDLVVMRQPTVSGAELWLVDGSSGTDIRRIHVGSDSGYLFHPVVSPDGQTIAYERRGSGIYTAPLSGGAEHLVAAPETVGSLARPGDWSPDGSRLLYVADGALWTAAPDGSDRVQLVPASERVRDATWSPDGGSVAYASKSQPGKVVVLNLATGVSTALPTHNHEHVWAGLDWQPLPPCSVQGTDAADTLAGTAGSDVICAGAGDDRIEETTGDDVVLAGPGQDVVAYDGVAPGVQVNITDMISRGAGTDMHMNTENVVGTAGADTLLGDPDAQSLVGGAGDDTIAGGYGADVLDGGTGRDTLTSILELDDHEGYEIDLAAGTSSEVARDGHIVIDTINGFEDVIGTRNPDVIRGDGADNVLRFGPSLAESWGSDIFEGRAGDDTLIGMYTLGTTAAYTNAPSGVTVDMVQGSVTGGDGHDTLTRIPEIEGTPFNDRFRLTSGAIVTGYAGDDTAVFTGFSDFHGGAGDDLADFSQMSHGVLVDSAYGVWTRWVDGEWPWRKVTDVERYILTPFQDVFNGSIDSDQVMAGSGGDLLSPGPQRASGSDHDTLKGGAGLDTLNATAFSNPLVVDLRAGWAQAPGIDVVGGIEGVRGSAYADRVLGTDQANTLVGNGGPDVLRGRPGPDILNGRDGADTIAGGLGRDRCRIEQRDRVTSCP